MYSCDLVTCRLQKQGILSYDGFSNHNTFIEYYYIMQIWGNQGTGFGHNCMQTQEVMISVLKNFISNRWDNRTEVFLIKYTLVYIYISICECQRARIRCFITVLGWVNTLWETRGSCSFKIFVLLFLQCSLWMRARVMLSKTQKNTNNGLTELMQNICICNTYFVVLIILQLWVIRIQWFSYIRK